MGELVNETIRTKKEIIRWTLRFLSDKIRKDGDHK